MYLYKKSNIILPPDGGKTMEQKKAMFSVKTPTGYNVYEYTDLQSPDKIPTMNEAVIYNKFLEHSKTNPNADIKSFAKRFKNLPYDEYNLELLHKAPKGSFADKERLNQYLQNEQVGEFKLIN